MEVQQPSQAKIPEIEEEQEKVIRLLEKRLEKHDNNRKVVQGKLAEILNKLTEQVYELEDRINKELEEKFTPEDNRLQAALSELRGNSTIGALQKAKAELLVEQSYEIIENKKVKFDFTTLYELKTERRFVPELLETRKPTNVRVTGVNRGRVSVEFTYLNPDEERVLPDNAIVNPVRYECLLFKKGNEQEDKEYPLNKDDCNDSSPSFFTFTPDILESETSYGTRVKMFIGDRGSEWSDVAEFTPEFKECCVWKECPDDVDDDRKYSVDGKNLRVATKINSDVARYFNNYCTIIGNTLISLSKVTSWSIKVHKSRDNDGCNIFVGVAPSDINQNDYNCNKCGWYFYCYWSELYSGPPHNYDGKAYGPRKECGRYVHTGDSVGIVVDTTKGDLSFVLGGVDLGVAYKGIPLDKPLVPSVLLKRKGDSVELIL